MGSETLTPSLFDHVRWRLWVEQRRFRLWFWKMEAALRARFRGAHRRNETLAAIQNQMPNDGAFPLDTNNVSSAEIIAAVTEPLKRQTGVAGFEGLALDDALVFSDDYKHFSFLREARAIVEIARLEFGRPDVSLLELGCGGGSLSSFLRLLGVRDYLGVDANPLAFRDSPHIRPFPEHFRLLNLQQEIRFGKTFDVVCTFEVLEHIREDMLEGLMQTIANHMGPHSIFLGSASLQEEYDVHVTVKPRAFWLERFAAHGLRPHPSERSYAALLNANHPFNWEPDNTNVFILARDDAASR